MSLFGTATPKHIVVKTYGRGGFLGLLSPLLAFFMASRGMNGWQQSAIREMEEDAVAMARRGYRIVSTQEFGIPLFGIIAYKVTYELVDAQS
jgi:hypothetical protein